MPEVIAVITTIQEPTTSVVRFGRVLGEAGIQLILIGDEKGPGRFDLEGCELIGLGGQLELPFSLAGLLPTNHYARKNLGYLVAISRGTECIYETDDDNAPLPSWKPRQLKPTVQKAEQRPWMNVYRAFSDELIWPRGFPLDQVASARSFERDPESSLVEVEAPIQQGLADGSPDVDAVWRLILDRDIRFERRSSIWLPPGTWCPFNSQSTWWWPAAYQLLYLPSYCSFRMTDIWRSFVAQRCLWELGAGVVFHPSEVIQCRNPHDLMRDFEEEVIGYTANATIARVLTELDLSPGPSAVGENLSRCYECLVVGGFLPKKELSLVEAWLRDVRSIEAQRSKATTAR